jgi:hypothetical protein
MSCQSRKLNGEVGLFRGKLEQIKSKTSADE